MTSADTTLLVTGGNGFVMSNLVRHWLASDDDTRAIVVDCMAPDPMVRRFFAGFEDRLESREGDVTDRALFGDLSGREDITHVVHGAAVTSINRMTTGGAGQGGGLAGALPALEANFLGTARVLAWAGDLPNLRRFIYVSTGSVYGSEGPAEPGAGLPEEGFVDPDGLYGLTKYASEMLTGQTARQFELPALAVRFASVFGPMDRETPARAVSLPPKLVLEKAMARQVIGMTDPDGVGDFIYAPDLADAVCRLLRAETMPKYPVYNVAFGRATRVSELVEMVAALLPGTRYEVVPEDQADLCLYSRQRGGRWGAYDISRLGEEFGWRPRPLPEALGDYLEWLRAEQQAEQAEGT